MNDKIMKVPDRFIDPTSALSRDYQERCCGYLIKYYNELVAKEYLWEKAKRTLEHHFSTRDKFYWQHSHPSMYELYKKCLGLGLDLAPIRKQGATFKK